MSPVTCSVASVLCVKKLKLNTYIADSAQLHSTVFISGGRRGLEIEIAPMDLAELLEAEFASITQS